MTVEISTQVESLNEALAQGLFINEAKILTKDLGLTPLNLFLGLVSVGRVSDAVEYAEKTRYDSIYPLAQKIRAGTFVRHGKTYHLPKKDDMTTFLEMVDKSEFKEAVAFGRRSRDEKVKGAAESLAAGGYTRKRDNFRVPPQPGEEGMTYFWYVYESKGPYPARDWLLGAKNLQWFLRTWDEGRARRAGGGVLAALVLKESVVHDSSALAKARARKKERSERDRNAHYAKSGTTGASQKKKAGGKKGRN